MKKIANIKGMGREDWLRLRKQGIGGSDAGAVAGMNPWKSAIDVFLDKTSGDIPEEKTTESMRLGTDLEEYVARRWEEATGKKVRHDYFMMQDEGHPWMIADIDRRVIGENAILECKTASPYAADSWKDGGVPPQYVIQCLHYLVVTGADRCYLACLVYGKGVEFRTIEPEPEAMESLVRIEEDFWKKNVEAGVMPEPDGSPSAEKALKKLYPSDDGGAGITITDIDLGRYDEVVALLGDLEKEKALIEQNIKAEMQDAGTAWIGSRKVTWKASKPRETIDSKKLKEDLPEVYEQYKKTGKPSRAFRISKKKEEA